MKIDVKKGKGIYVEKPKNGNKAPSIIHSRIQSEREGETYY